jgi:hypothetical protein
VILHAIVILGLDDAVSSLFCLFITKCNPLRPLDWFAPISAILRSRDYAAITKKLKQKDLKWPVLTSPTRWTGAFSFNFFEDVVGGSSKWRLIWLSLLSDPRESKRLRDS